MVKSSDVSLMISPVQVIADTLVNKASRKPRLVENMGGRVSRKVPSSMTAR